MRLAKSDLSPLLQQLHLMFPGGTGRKPEQLLEGYYGALEDCPLRDVQFAVDVIKREDQHFPRASRIRKLALEHRLKHPDQGGSTTTLKQRYDAWVIEGFTIGQPCPVCGSCLDHVGGRYGITHDRQLHHNARIGFFGRNASNFA